MVICDFVIANSNPFRNNCINYLISPIGRVARSIDKSLRRLAQTRAQLHENKKKLGRLRSMLIYLFSQNLEFKMHHAK